MTDSRTPATPVESAGIFLKGCILLLLSLGVGYLAAQKLNLGNVPGVVVGASIFGVGAYALMNLRDTPTALWMVFSLKLFTVIAYKLVTVVLVSFLMKDCGISDANAQWIFGIWGMFMSIATLLAGSLTDALGLRRTLLTGIVLCLLTRLVLLCSGNSAVVLLLGLIPLAVGEALCTPVLVAATRKYTNASQRSVAFSVFYAILNLGFMFAYFIRDGVQSEAAHSSDVMHLAGFALSPQRFLFLVSLSVEALALPFILALRGDVGSAGSGGSWAATLASAATETGRLFGTLVRHPAFRRLLVFLLMIGLLKIVFNIMDAVLPTFAEREIGTEGAKSVGRLNAVNSILILVLAPLVGTLTRKLPAYSMVILGGFITASSFTFMVLPASGFEGMAASSFGSWIGHEYLRLSGVIHPYLIMILLWQVVFSIGEAFYSPRVYEYAVSIAPKGQEASYASLSAVPLLMGKLINSAAFAGLLTRFCPAEGPRDPGKMWLIVGLLVLVAPIGLLVFRRFIRVPEEGRET
jgi:MFS family permease